MLEWYDSAQLRLSRMKELVRYIEAHPDGVSMLQLKKFATLHFGMVLKTFDVMIRQLAMAHVIEDRCLRFWITQSGKRWLQE